MAEKKEFVLEGLDCPSCAAKIEENVKKLEGIENVSLNFIKKTLVVNVNDEAKIEEIKHLVKKIEPDVEVYDKNNKNETSHNHNDEDFFNRKLEIIKLFSGLVIFLREWAMFPV